MEHESGTIECDICCAHNNSLIVLQEQEKVLGRKLFKFIALHRTPRATCRLCLSKLYNFKDFLREILLNQAKLSATHDLKMEEDPNEDGSQNEKHYDRYNCTCSACQTKHGSLPLLVDVIEQNEPKTEPVQPEPQPSTSQDTSPRSPKKQMKCGHCDKTFTHKGDLNKHLRKHTGEQPFICPTCNRRFAHTSNLTRHMRLHSGSRPFVCEACRKTFSRKDKLELHRKSKACKRR